MTVQEIIEELNLEGDNKDSLIDWRNNFLSSTKIDGDEFDALLTKSHEEEKTMIETMDIGTYMQYLQSIVVAASEQLLPPVPGTLINVMPIGRFPPNVDNKKQITADTLVWVMREGVDKPEAGKLKAWGAERVAQRDVMQLFNEYLTEVNYNPQRQTEGTFNGSHHENTNFTEPVSEGAFPATLQERIASVMGTYPHITLAQSRAKENISRLMQSDLGNGKKTNPYVNKNDLKVIQVTIRDVNFGINDQTGMEWCSVSVVDSTFVPTQNHKGMTVYMDPFLVRSQGTGPGSFVSILGNTKFDKNGEHVLMNGCALIVHKQSPLVEETKNLGGANTGAVDEGNYTPNINISLTE